MLGFGKKRAIFTSGVGVGGDRGVPPPLPALPFQRAGWQGWEDEFPRRGAALSVYCEAWMNEKFAPELLESKSEIVECVMEQLEHMEENLRRAKRGDLKVSIHRMEMERIRYVLSSYLRCRLMKIEKFFPHILEKEKTRPSEEPSILSPEEFVFVKEYMDHTETHLKNVALKHMPPNLQKVDLLRAVRKPDLDSYVFLRVKERQENILVEPEADEQRDYVIDLEEGSQHLIRYKTIAPLVASGAVQLI
ncbi:DNA replication complex GINS protein SLD5 isoform X3 [Peromyscus californicus insignis]|uniref:DNA replication complex GINS protein SLD5 isoform X3 n=1 Tax=Peromyscus californicus insignis TaxID=564181 RepID=UPI0022A7F8AD|nr:DNA replication complex GINS protein SLD5 isoform X3 [Peromyscus californicus insignis]